MSMASNVEVTARKHRSACASCLLDEIGVQEEDLSQGGRRTLGILAQVACVLNVDQVHMSEYAPPTHLESGLMRERRYLAVMDALSERHSNATDAVCTLEDEMKRIAMRNDRTRQEMAHLAHMHESMRLMAEEREISENSGMFKHWARDNGEKERRYAQEIQHCHAELRARRFPLDESLEHHSLVALAEQCAALDEKNYELATQLALYSALPSTIPDAQRMLDSMEADLMHLEAPMSSAGNQELTL